MSAIQNEYHGRTIESIYGEVHFVAGGGRHETLAAAIAEAKAMKSAEDAAKAEAEAKAKAEPEAAPVETPAVIADPETESAL